MNLTRATYLKMLPWISALAFVLVVLSPTPSHAQALLVQCVGTEATTFSPGLTNTEQSTQVTISNNLPLCLHLLIPPLLMPATANSQFTRQTSCTALLGGGPGARTLQWSNGETSTFSFVSSASLVNGNLVAVQTGTIVAGRYAGKSAVATTVLTPLLAGNPVDFLVACNTPGGVTDLQGTFSLSITP